METEVRREAEVVRQTRESDMDTDLHRHASLSTTHSSPSLGPTTQESLERISEDDLMTDLSSSISGSFKHQAIRNSKGKEFWETFDDQPRTPNLASLARASSSVLGDEISVDLALSSTQSSSFALPSSLPTNSTDHSLSSPSRSTTPQSAAVGPTAADITRKINNKRRRDDDFDMVSLKRRAVSPGMSVHNSPVMQSPMQREHAPWGSRPPSGGDGVKSTNGGPAKRVGFQGMENTNDGLMKMSIE